MLEAFSECAAAKDFDSIYLLPNLIFSEVACNGYNRDLSTNFLMVVSIHIVVKDLFYLHIIKGFRFNKFSEYNEWFKMSVC